MGMLSNLFFRPQHAPLREVTDEVIPLHSWDVADHAQGYSLVLTYQFDEVLETEKLARAWEHLLTIGGWKKLGARLRQNAGSGRLEYHLPSVFTKERPGVVITSVKHETAIQDHPVASLLPQRTNSPGLSRASTFDLLPYVTHPDSPKTIDDWLNADLPQLSMHVVIFDNATLLTLTYPCTLTDATGAAAIMRAWATVLNGKINEVPSFQGFREDLFATVGDAGDTDQFIYSGNVLSTLGTLMFILRDLWDQFWYPTYEKRLLCVPNSFLSSLRSNMLKELREDSQDKTDPFISEGDVLVAWWARLAAIAHRASPERLLTLVNIMSVRQEYLGTQHGAYVGNAAMTWYTLVPAGQVLTRPLSTLAHRLRQSLIAQRVREQIEAQAALIKGAGHPPLVGDPHMQMFTFSNWHKGRFFDVDFSAARKASSQQPSGPCTPSVLVPNVFIRKSSPLRFTGAVIVGKDQNGNWWLDVTMRKEALAEFEQQLKKMAQSSM